MLNEGTSAVTQQLTGETGEFLFNFVPVGSYTLKIGMPGFKTYEGRGIPLGASQNVRRTYVLEVGNITDNVTVTGEAPMVNTLSPEQRFNLETLEVRNLPMINRNITNVLTVGSGLTKGEATSNGFGGNRFRLNGLGGTSMTVTADGTDASGHPGEGSLSLYGSYNKIDVMSAESVSEAQVVKGVIPAEYGSAMAGSVSLIMRSGTNQWHGSLFHRYEGSVLSARNPILAREPNSVWNQFGGSLGGPVKRDRVFFFFAYEGYRQRTTVATTPIVAKIWGRDNGSGGYCRPLPIALVCKKEKDPVSFDGPAEGASELIPHRVGFTCEDRIAGREHGAFIAMKQAAVPLVRPRPHDQADAARHRRTILCRDDALDDLCLGNRFRAHHVDFVITAVQAQRALARVAAGVRSIGRDGHRGAAEPIQPETVSAKAVGGCFSLGQPGPDSKNVRDIAVDHRQIPDLERFKIEPLLGRQCVDHRRFARDGHIVRNVADLENVCPSHVL